ncbi:UDP-N-acetylglucosamine 4,6-dehydratase (inverting) [candidate division GN15 bacterium]|nr:UDP-N-acetylglucosamine 4,6-dehydratase (inverting) [candidate division GN15 bacterium]
MLTNKSILVTGGTGSFGKSFVRTVLKKYPRVRRVVVYSRDELKQFEMAQLFPPDKYPQMRFFIGDVRDKERLARAMEDVDVVVHAAALKQVPAAEYNPFECIKTNVIGAQNVIDSAIQAGVKKVVALSTDKAAAPINLYGATKLCSDKLFVSANNFVGRRDIKLSVVRYGNVMGSRGSVIPFFMDRAATGSLPITDTRMTRFNITLQEGVDLVLFAIAHMWGGEIFVPKIPSYRILDVAEAVAPGCKKNIVGIRPGEKLHEEMITETDAIKSLEFEKHFVILPSMNLWDVDRYLETYNGRYCRHGFSYSSGSNEQWLTVDEIRRLIREHVDPDFSVEEPAVEQDQTAVRSIPASESTTARETVTA